MPFCSKCGKELPSNSNFCQTCGKNIVDKTVMPKSVEPGKVYEVPRKNKIIGVILIIAPIAGLVFILVAYAIANFIMSSILNAT